MKKFGRSPPPRRSRPQGQSPPRSSRPRSVTSTQGQRPPKPKSGQQAATRRTSVVHQQSHQSEAAQKWPGTLRLRCHCKQRHPRSYERTKEAECAHCFVPLEPNAQGLFGRSETHPKAMGAFPQYIYILCIYIYITYKQVTQTDATLSVMERALLKLLSLFLLSLRPANQERNLSMFTTSCGEKNMVVSASTAASSYNCSYKPWRSCFQTSVKTTNGQASSFTVWDRLNTDPPCPNTASSFVRSLPGARWPSSNLPRAAESGITAMTGHSVVICLVPFLVGLGSTAVQPLARWPRA